MVTAKAIMAHKIQKQNAIISIMLGKHVIFTAAIHRQNNPISNPGKKYIHSPFFATLSFVANINLPDSQSNPKVAETTSV